MDKLTMTTVVLGLLTASTARAQCKPPLNSNEAKLLAFYEAPVVFAPAGPPLALAPGQIGIVGELEPVPAAPRALDNTHLCYRESTQSGQHDSANPLEQLVVLGLGGQPGSGKR